MLGSDDLEQIRSFKLYGDYTPTPGERLILMRAHLPVNDDTISALRFAVDGFGEQFKDWENEGHREGYDAGFIDGYDEGWDAGYEHAKEKLND